MCVTVGMPLDGVMGVGAPVEGMVGVDVGLSAGIAGSMEVVGMVPIWKEA